MLEPDRQFCDPVTVNGDSYYRIRVPSVVDELHDFGPDMWDQVYVPKDMLTLYKFNESEDDYETFGFSCDVRVDGMSIFSSASSLGDMPALHSRFGDFGVITADSDLSFSYSSPKDGSSGRISCKELFNRLTAKNEYLMSRTSLCDVEQVYQSCAHDYQDENPITRTIRSVRLGHTPSENAEQYREWYVANRDYDDLPAEAGFVSLKHTVLRKDMISPEIVDINGRPCRKLFVPTASGFFAETPDDKKLCEEVYIPSEYFFDLPENFDLARDGSPYASLDYSNERPFVHRRPDGFKSQYAVCSIPVDDSSLDTFPIFNADGSQSDITPSVFSASFTCLTSNQFYHGNLNFDLDRFSKLFDTVVNLPAGGAFLNRLELQNDVPAVDFERNDEGNIILPDFDTFNAVRGKIERYNQSQVIRSGERHANDENAHGVSRLNSRVNREAGLKSLFNIMLRDRVNLKVASAANDDIISFDESEDHIEIDSPDDLYVPEDDVRFDDAAISGVPGVPPVASETDEPAGSMPEPAPVLEPEPEIPEPDGYSSTAEFMVLPNADELPVPPEYAEAIPAEEYDDYMASFTEEDIPGEPYAERDMSDILRAAGCIEEENPDLIVDGSSFEF